MGTLFPDSPEFRDHRSPTSFPTAKQTVVGVGLTAAMYGLCPKNEERRKHPPHEDHAPSSFRVIGLGAGDSSTGGGGAMSGGPWGNSVFAANDRIIRNAWSQNLHRRMAASSSMSSAAVL